MAMDRFLLFPVLLLSVSLLTSAKLADYDSGTCDSDPVDCDCKYIQKHLPQFCDETPKHWGEMSGCHVDMTGLNYSISWCPKFIRNATCVSHMMIRVNFFEFTTSKTFEKGTADLVAYIPGFDNPIFSKTFENQQCEKLMDNIPKGVPSFIKDLLKCPLSFEEMKKIVSFIQKGSRIPNPLPTIVPAGSYHLTSNVTTSPNNDMFLCVDGWLEFGV